MNDELFNALTTLLRVHVPRFEDQDWYVMMGATPHGYYDQERYVPAWEAVREFVLAERRRHETPPMVTVDGAVMHWSDGTPIRPGDLVANRTYHVAADGLTTELKP
jgi:hypothetical protein